MKRPLSGKREYFLAEACGLGFSFTSLTSLTSFTSRTSKGFYDE